MNFYLRHKSSPVPFEIDADALRYWLGRACHPPHASANLSPFFPKNGRAGIIDAATARGLVKAISAFAMEDGDEAEETRTLAAAKLFQACRNPPLTVSEK